MRPSLRICIICRNEKPVEEFNEEHIFLETIGGDLRIETVCIDCNSRLSNSFNKRFLNDPRIGICRQLLKLNRGKRGISNPLVKAKVSGEDGDKYYVTFENGQPKINRKPEHEISSGKEGWEVIVRGNPDVVEKRMEEIVKKYGYTEEELINVSKEVNNVTRCLMFTTTNDGIILEGLKVAYEFTVTAFDEYLEDEWGKEYAKFLETGIMTEIVRRRIDNAEKYNDVCRADYEMLKTKSPTYMHCIYLKSYKNYGTICMVKMFSYITFYCMSDKELIDENRDVLIINDPLSRKCFAFMSEVDEV